jgi:hypothetical protein
MGQKPGFSKKPGFYLEIHCVSAPVRVEFPSLNDLPESFKDARKVKPR